MLIPDEKPGAVRAAHEVDEVLIRKAQAYLESRSQGGTADADLEGAWIQFLEACSPLVRYWVRQYGVRYGEVTDVVDEAWGEITFYLPRFRGLTARAFHGWLRVLVYRLVVKPVRAKYRHPVSDLSCLCGTKQEPVDERADPVRSCQRQEQGQLVRLVLEQLKVALTEVDYRLLVGHDLEQRKVVDIAGDLGLTPGQARVHLHRARGKFRSYWRGRTGKAFDAH